MIGEEVYKIFVNRLFCRTCIDDNISHHDGLIALNNVHEERVERLITLRWDFNGVLLSLSAIYQHVFSVVRRLCIWIRVRLEAEPNVSRCSRRRCEGNAATFWEREWVDVGVVSKACPVLRPCWEGVGLCFGVCNSARTVEGTRREVRCYAARQLGENAKSLHLSKGVVGRCKHGYVRIGIHQCLGKTCVLNQARQC